MTNNEILLKAISDLHVAAQNLEKLWDHTGTNMIDGYPKCLPSFDELVVEIGEWYRTQKMIFTEKLILDEYEKKEKGLSSSVNERLRPQLIVHDLIDLLLKMGWKRDSVDLCVGKSVVNLDEPVETQESIDPATVEPVVVLEYDRAKNCLTIGWRG